jgi:O-antigen/teichoic acid export membrane protein
MWGLLGAASAQCLAFAVNFLFVWKWAKKYYDSGIELGVLSLLIAVCAVAYACANLIYHPQDLYVDLAYKAAVFTGAALVLGVIALREIGRLSPGVYDTIRSAAHRFKVGVLVP